MNLFLILLYLGQVVGVASLPRIFDLASCERHAAEQTAINRERMGAKADDYRLLCVERSVRPELGETGL